MIEEAIPFNKFAPDAFKNTFDYSLQGLFAKVLQ